MPGLLPVFVFLLALAMAQPAGVAPSFNNTDLYRLLESGSPDLPRTDALPYQKQIREFYAAGNYDLAWIKAMRPSPQALALIQMLQNADQDGLRARDYDAAMWGNWVTQLTQSTPAANADLARFDLALTVTAMRYIGDLCCGRVDPNRLNVHLNPDRKQVNLPQFLRTRLINAQDVASVLRELDPPYSGYQRTKAALQLYLKLAQEGEGEPLPPLRKTLKPGDTYAGLAALEQRLRRLGDLPPDKVAASNSGVYGEPLVDAVKHFQQRHGLTPDGKIDAATFKQLTIPLAYRVKQLQYTIERFRWLPSGLASPLIAVNIPEFMLRGYENHQAALKMRVIVGKAFRDRQTPVFQDTMEYVIFRPYWNVPTRITHKELIPDLEKKPGYLTKHQYELVDQSGHATMPEEISAETFQQLRAGELAIRQKPGEQNALGAIKFVFPNHFDVYMHGTPEQKLFSRTRRDFSHGCIRVEDPAALAQWVLRDNPGWTRERIKSAMNAETSMKVNLPKPLKVLILYGTAVVEDNGEVHFFQDIYGQDAKLDRALTIHR